MVCDGIVLLVFFDCNIVKDCLLVLVLMVVGVIQICLVDKSLCCDVNIIVEIVSVCDLYYFVVLFGFGVMVIYLYFVYEMLVKLVDSKVIDKLYCVVMLNYCNGINKGLYKIMFKMGILIIVFYCCLKLFEVVGLYCDVFEFCFQGVVSCIGGVSFDDFQQDLLNLLKCVWLVCKLLVQGGLLKYVYGGEYYVYNLDVVCILQQVVQSGEYSDY